MTGWQGDVAGWARRLAEAADRITALTDAHAGHVLDYRRAVATVRDPAALGDAVGSVASTAAEASATKPAPAPVGFVAAAADAGGETKPVAEVIDPDDLFDAIEDVLQDMRDAPGIPQEVLQGVPDVPGMSFATALKRLADAHAAASGDGPLGDLVAAAAAVVGTAPPYLPPAPRAPCTVWPPWWRRNGGRHRPGRLPRSPRARQAARCRLPSPAERQPIRSFRQAHAERGPRWRRRRPPQMRAAGPRADADSAPLISASLLAWTRPAGRAWATTCRGCEPICPALPAP